MNKNTKTVVGVGILTAMVIVLQLLGSFIKFGTFSITLVLAPVIVGAALYGVGAGVWLGFVFGGAVLASGDASLFLGISPLGTVVTVLAKGAIAGLAAALVYKLIEKKSRIAAVIAAGIICPLANTGVFLVGCYIFFQDWIVGAFGTTSFTVVVAGLVGVNFLIELGINMVLATVIERIVRIGKKEIKADSSVEVAE